MAHTAVRHAAYHDSTTYFPNIDFNIILSTKRVFPKHLLSGTTISEYTGYTQKNGAVSKVNKKFTSHFTRAQRTPSAAATVQVSRVLPAVRFSCLLWGRGASFQDGVAAGKGFLCAPF